MGNAMTKIAELAKQPRDCAWFERATSYIEANFCD